MSGPFLHISCKYEPPNPSQTGSGAARPQFDECSCAPLPPPSLPPSALRSYIREPLAALARTSERTFTTGDALADAKVLECDHNSCFCLVTLTLLHSCTLALFHSCTLALLHYFTVSQIPIQSTVVLHSSPHCRFEPIWGRKKKFEQKVLFW